MPGLDGTGPRGMGPLTGGGRGFCVLRLPNRPGEPSTGFAGRAGCPVSQPFDGEAELAHLRSQALQIKGILRHIRGRIERLEAGRRQTTVGV